MKAFMVQDALQRKAVAEVFRERIAMENENKQLRAANDVLRKQVKALMTQLRLVESGDGD